MSQSAYTHDGTFNDHLGQPTDFTDITSQERQEMDERLLNLIEQTRKEFAEGEK